VSPTGVAWVADIPEGSAHADLTTGSASLHLRNICVFDAFTVGNSVDTTRPLGNIVKGLIDALDVEWSGIQSRVTNFSDADNCFRGDFVENTATIAVTATTPPSLSTQIEAPGCVTNKINGFRFVSGPASGNVSEFAQIGHERNGIFF